jgi:2'-5' RNA ligase
MDMLNRCSLGIRVPAEFAPKLTELQQMIRHRAGTDAIRWNGLTEMFIPIMVFGEIQIPTLEQIKKVLPGLCMQSKPMSLSIEGLMGIPSNLQPRFLCCGVTGDVETLTALHNACEDKISLFLREYQRKPYQPHIDLGRIKVESEQARTALGRGIRLTPVGCLLSMEVKSIDLLMNTITPTGPTYALHATYPLGGG